MTAAAARILSPALKDEFHRIVGERIKLRREQGGFTVRSLAEAAGINHSTVNNAEIGQTISLYVLAVLADALDTTLDDLVPTEALT